MPSSAWKSYVCSRSEEHTSELQSLTNLVCRLLLENNILSGHVGDSAESFTSHQCDWRKSPGNFGYLGDLAFCGGVTEFSLHDMVHQSFFLMIGRPPRSPLFPYKRLYR